MCKKLVVFLLLLLLFMFAGSASAVVTPLTEDFTDDIDFAFTANPNYGVFNGEGQLVQSVVTDQIFRVGQAGDAHVEMDMGIESVLNDSYVIWTYQWNDNVLGTKMQLWLQKASIEEGQENSLWVYLGNMKPTIGWVTQKWLHVGDVTNFAFEYDWVEATASYDVSIAINGGAMTPYYSDTGVVSGNIPVEYMYGGGAGSALLDNYSIVPEPATMLLLGLGGLALIRRRRA